LFGWHPAAPEVPFLLPIDNTLWNQGIIGFFSSVGGGGTFPLLLEGGDARGEALPLSFGLDNAQVWVK